MNLLLDTSIAIWAVQDDERVTAQARAMISDVANTVWFSDVTLIEIAIKRVARPTGEGAMPFGVEAAVWHFIETGFSQLSISAEHAATLETLPLLHRDPFDRLLVAQAISEPLRLVTADAALAQYSDTVILV